MGKGPFSPSFHAATELIGKRWNGAIIYCLFHELTRFSDIKDAIPGLSARMLSERLKELETNGVIERIVIPETPVRIEYSLTAKGQALREVMLTLHKWAKVWHTEQTE
ncbi:MAG TPA: helix-turn-helix domain-containing protein [Anaerolineae bacterium]|nr:helix-turn-helix domain-containing protein [Anaerolineae bacterium]